MIYSVVHMDMNAGASGEAIAAIKDRLLTLSKRTLFLGCFQTEIGQLNRVTLLHGGETAEILSDELTEILGAPELPGLNGLAREIATDFFRLFPGMPDITPGSYGPFFEIRTYTLHPHGLPGTLAAWAKALPARSELSRPVGVLHSLTGTGPRIFQIWPYRDLNERVATRAEAVRRGVWPPEGGRARIYRMQSDIYLAAPYSPIQ